jgi:hypothetical protein
MNQVKWEPQVIFYSFCMNQVKLVENWYSYYSFLFEALPVKWKVIKKHLVQETWLRMCGRIVLKLNKGNKVWNSWDLSRCNDTNMEVVVKNLECFKHFVTYEVSKLKISEEES